MGSGIGNFHLGQTLDTRNGDSRREKRDNKMCTHRKYNGETIYASMCNKKIREMWEKILGSSKGRQLVRQTLTEECASWDNKDSDRNRQKIATPTLKKDSVTKN